MDKKQEFEAVCARCGSTDVKRDKEQEHPGVGTCGNCGYWYITDRPKPTPTK